MARALSRLAQRLRLPRIEVAWPAPEAASPVVTVYMVWVSALVLTVIGLVMSFSASAVTNIAAGEDPYVAFLKPAAIAVVSLGAMFAASRVPTAWWRTGAVVLFLVSLGMQSLVLTPLATEAGGNRNWIHFPGIPVPMQPSEFVKLGLILMLGVQLSHPGVRLDEWRSMLKHAGLPVLLALGAVMLGHDMGTAMVVFAAAVGALLVGGLKWTWFRNLGIAVIPLGVFFVAMNPTRVNRILAVLPWMKKERDLSAPEQIDHAMWAFGSGGLFGLGPGASREKWNYLQAANTDFVLAILGEEFGFVGVCVVFIAVAVLVWGMYRVSMSARTLFVRVAAAGVASWVGAQAVVNVLSVSGIGPVIGVPLPLVSYGGSSLLLTSTAIGVVLSFARAEAGFARVERAAGGRDPRVAARRRPSGR